MKKNRLLRSPVSRVRGAQACGHAQDSHVQPRNLQEEASRQMRITTSAGPASVATKRYSTVSDGEKETQSLTKRKCCLRRTDRVGNLDDTNFRQWSRIGRQSNQRCCGQQKQKTHSKSQ